MRRHPERFGLSSEKENRKTIHATPSIRPESGISELQRYESLSIGELRAQCPFFNALQKYVHLKLDKEELLSLIEKLYRRYLANNSTTIAIVSLGHIDNIASMILQNHFNPSSPGEVPILSGDIFIGLIIRYFKDRNATHGDLEEIKEITEYIAKHGYDQSEIERTVGMFDSKMADMWYAQKYVEAISERLVESGFNVEDHREAYRNSTNELILGIRQLRRYSIASSLYQDDITHREGQGWVVMDPASLRKVHPDLHEILGQSLATLIYTQNANDVQEISVKTWRDTYSSALFQIDRLDFSFPSLFRWELAHDGEIYLHTHPLMLSLKDICVRMGHEGIYEFIRFLFIAHLFDLVVPIEVSEQAPSLNDLRKKISDIQKETGETPDTIIRKLVLPRKVILKNTDSVQAAIDRSQDEGHAEVERRTGKKIEHRIGSPVTIREGYKRHPQAVEWAAEYGVTLKDNETWRQPIDKENPLRKIVYKSTKSITVDSP